MSPFLVSMKIRGLALTLALALFAPSSAGASSIFSLFFLGDRNPRGDARSRALGFSTLALPDASSALVGNPARYAYLDKATLSTLVVMGTAKSSNPGAEYRLGFVEFPSLFLAVPLTGNIVMGAGYRVSEDAEGELVLFDETSTGEPYEQRYEKGGSLFEIPLSIAARWRDRLTLGVSYLFVRGTVRESWTLDFADPSFVPGTTEREGSFSGSTAELGLQVRPTRALTVGLYYRPAGDIDVTVRERFSTTADTASMVRTDHFPEILGGGLALSLGSRWLAVGEVMTQDWTRYEGREFWEQVTHRETAVRIGLERKKGLAGAPLLRRLPLRLGYAYRVLPFTEPQGQSVQQHAVTLGTGVGIGSGLGSVDFSFEYIKTGTVSDNGLTEDQFRFGISLSGGDSWARR